MRVPSNLRHFLLGAMLVVAGTCNHTGLAQDQTQKADETQSKAALPMPLSGFSDEGVFHLYVNEDRLLSATFEWQTDGTFYNQATLSMAGQTVTTTTKIMSDQDGGWMKITMDTPQGLFTTVRDGDVARRTLKEKTETVNLKPGAVLFENYSPTDRYHYDPGDPTPAPYFYEEPEEEEQKVRSSEEKKKEREAYNEKVTQSRQDILVYVSEPFDQPYTFVGPVSAVLYASTSARDTDWFVRLMEVDQEGKILGLAEGKIRARFRRSMKTPELLKPGKVYEYTLDLWHTGITIPAGHRLRVEVASASFPMFSRNLNTGGHNEVETKYVTAKQTIYHTRPYPSHILLPVIPDMATSAPDSGDARKNRESVHE